MRKKFTFGLLSMSFLLSAQVGINTPNPTRTLDVEGNVRIKTVEDKSADAAYTNILVQNPTTGAIDMISKSNIGGTEPWKIQGGTTAGTLNTQNIYQNAKVGIGDFSTTSMPGNEMLRVSGADLHLLNGYIRNTIAGTTNPPTYILGRSRGDIGAHTNVQKDDVIGRILFSGYYTSFTDSLNGNTAIQVFAGASKKTSVMQITAPSASEGFIGSRNTQEWIRFNEDRSTTIGNLVDGNTVTNFPYSVVAKADGTLGVTSGKKYSIEPLAETATLDLSILKEQELKDLYVINATATITLPLAFHGRVQRFFIYGGSADVTFKGTIGASIHNSSTSNGFIPHTGAVYSGTGSGTQLRLSGPPYRFRFIEFLCVGNVWYFSND